MNTAQDRQYGTFKLQCNVIMYMQFTIEVYN